MKYLSLKKSALVALVLLQCTAIVHSQAVGGGDVAGPSNNPVGPAATDPVVNPPADPTPTPPVVAPTTTEETKPTADPTTAPPPTTTPKPNPPATSDPSPPAQTSDPTKPNSKSSNNDSEETEVDNNTNKPTDTGAPVGPTGSLTGGPSSTPNSTKNGGDKENKETNNTAVIAGSVVGGLVGIALIAGLLTWLNRHGGCTSRTRRRDIQDDFDAHDNAYDLKMTENHNIAAAGAATSGADNLPPPSPFQHARRFVPPTSNPTGYMNLTDEEYGYHQQNTAYQPQGVYQEYNNSEYDYQQQQQQQQHQPHPEYGQHDYGNEYGQQQQDYVPHHEYANEYQHEGSVNGSTAVNGAGYQQAYYHTSSNITSPTLTNTVPAALNDPYRQQLKPDQIEQKPNAA